MTTKIETPTAPTFEFQPGDRVTPDAAHFSEPDVITGDRGLAKFIGMTGIVVNAEPGYALEVRFGCATVSAGPECFAIDWDATLAASVRGARWVHQFGSWVVDCGRLDAAEMLAVATLARRRNAAEQRCACGAERKGDRTGSMDGGGWICGQCWTRESLTAEHASPADKTGLVVERLEHEVDGDWSAPGFDVGLDEMRAALAREELEFAGVDCRHHTTGDLVAHYDTVIAVREAERFARSQEERRGRVFDEIDTMERVAREQSGKPIAGPADAIGGMRGVQRWAEPWPDGPWPDGLPIEYDHASIQPTSDPSRYLVGIDPGGKDETHMVTVRVDPDGKMTAIEDSVPVTRPARFKVGDAVAVELPGVPVFFAVISTVSVCIDAVEYRIKPDVGDENPNAIYFPKMLRALTPQEAEARARAAEPGPTVNVYGAPRRDFASQFRKAVDEMMPCRTPGCSHRVAARGQHHCLTHTGPEPGSPAWWDARLAEVAPGWQWAKAVNYMCMRWYIHADGPQGSEYISQNIDGALSSGDDVDAVERERIGALVRERNADQLREHAAKVGPNANRDRVTTRDSGSARVTCYEEETGRTLPTIANFDGRIGELAGAK